MAFHHARKTALQSCSRAYTTTNLRTTAAEIFKDPQAAKFVAAIGNSAQVPDTFLHRLPEIIVTGRANAGKSTLLNAVIGRNQLTWTGKKAARTRQMNFFRVGKEPGNLIVVDAPGYGATGRPEWGSTFDAYIAKRKWLKRVYVLLNGKHTLDATDIAMLESLNKRCLDGAGVALSVQAVITKVDALPAATVSEQLQKLQKQIFTAAPTCLPPILFSSRRPMVGVDELRMSITEACELG